MGEVGLDIDAGQAEADALAFAYPEADPGPIERSGVSNLARWSLSLLARVERAEVALEVCDRNRVAAIARQRVHIRERDEALAFIRKIADSPCAGGRPSVDPRPTCNQKMLNPTTGKLERFGSLCTACKARHFLDAARSEVDDG